MDSFVPNKRHLREAILFCYNQKKKAAETYRLVVQTYGDHAPTQKTCENWFKQFKEGIYDVEDAEREGRPKQFEDAELETLLDEDPCQTQSELAAVLHVTHQAISHRLKSIGMIKKDSYWVPHELTERQMENRKTICEMLIERQKRKGFLYRIVLEMKNGFTTRILNAKKHG